MDSRCTTNKQCCIYYRYNSDAERENYEESLRREACGWIGGDVHVFCDEGNDTASLNLLMRCVMARRVSVLITISLDMLGNDPLIVKNHVLTLVFMRVELIVKSTKICFSAEEILLRSIIAYNSFGSQWINEYGYYFEHRKNIIHAGNCPFGYMRRPDGTPAVDEAEAHAVRRIFEMCANGMKGTEISERIANEDGFRFTRSAINSIIKNRRYCGEDGTKPGVFPPLVTNGLWLKANSIQHMRTAIEREGRGCIISRIFLLDTGRWTKLADDEGTEYVEVISRQRYEVNAKKLTGFIGFIVGDMLAEKGEECREDVLAHIRNSRQKLLEQLMDIEQNGYFGSTSIESRLEELSFSDIDGFETLKNMVNETRHRQVRAKLDYLMCCTDEDMITAYFDRMMMYPSLGMLEKRYYTDLLVKKLSIGRDCINIRFIDESVYDVKLDKPVILPRA